MKKVISIVLILVLVCSLSVAMFGCKKTPRDKILKIYVPGEYIDEDIFKEFENWYAERTDGKEITVQVETFDSVENVQTALEGSKADFDLICPSDYMIEYLISKGLVQAVDKSIIDVKKEGLFKEEYIAITEEFDPGCLYSVPYMYGTLGLVYDYSKTNEKIDSWEALFGSKYAGKNPIRRSIKNSMRDAYAAACLYNARATLNGLEGEAKKAAVQSVFMDTSEATVNAAKNTLLNVKSGGAVWDVDNMKYQMASDPDNKIAVALMWSCDAGYVMNTYEDEDGVSHDGNHNLWYVVPKEGGNVYLDSFVIGKYAGNVTAANYFLAFLCEKSTALANSEYAGTISPVAAAYDELYEYYMEDEDGIFTAKDIESGWKDMFLEMLFPGEETLNRCGVMKDFKQGKNHVVEMWGSIK